MKPVIALIHGINSFDGGKDSTGTLRPYYEQAGYEVIELRYRWMLWLGTYIFNRSLAKKFAKILEGKEVIFVCHSNGNVIANIATERYGVNARGLIAINPALDRDTAFPEAYDFIHVYYNHGDIPTKYAAWIPKHPWGAMGRYGYKGSDGRVVNLRCGNKPHMPQLDGHSDMFETENNKRRWSRYQIEKIPAQFNEPRTMQRISLSDNY